MGESPDYEEIRVGIAQYRVAGSPFRLVTLGLGSCVGVAFYDDLNGLGGMAHVMLPDSQQFPGQYSPGKFADSALPVLLEEMVRRGADRRRLVAKLAGGAQMFNANNRVSLLSIGRRNVAAVKETLRNLGIKIGGEDTGGHVGRTMILDTSTGEVYVRTIGQPLKLI